MKRILFIAPHSFPISSSESICNSKIAYTLADMGYMVDVFSCTDPYNYPQNNEMDIILESHKNLKIHYVLKRKNIKRCSFHWDNIVSIFSHLIAFFRTGYFYNGSVLPYDIIRAIENTNKPHGNLSYDVMITRGFLTDIAGLYIKKKYGIRWIANWNDPYTEEKFPPPYGKGPNAHLNLFKKKIYVDVQKYVDLHTFPNPRLRDYMLSCFTKVDQKHTFVIPHMAMAKFIINKKDFLKNKNKLTIIHCGNVRSPRNPSLFIEALAKLKEERAFYEGDLSVQFVGLYDPILPERIKELHLEGIVELLPPVSYDQCLTLIAGCHVSLVIEAICEEGIYLPTKVVDSIQSSTPVFCVSPQKGMLNDIVNKYNIGYVCDNQNLDDIKANICKLIEDYRMGNIPVINLQVVPCFFDDSIKQLYSQIL